jgi:hypothetical protein
MSGPDENAAAGEPTDYDVAEIDEISYLRFVEATLCEWLSDADAEAYDGL